MKNIYAISLLFIPFIIYGQSEIKINSYTDNDQIDPHVVTDYNGSFLSVWSSSNQANDSSGIDIYMQRLDENLNKVGNEILVNDSTAGDQIKSAAAMNTNGDCVITWASFTGFNTMYDIKAKIFKNDDTGSQEFTVNTFTLHTQTKPSVDILDDGSFVIVWESWFEDGSDRGIFGQRFLADGSKQGGAFSVNSYTKYSQARPAVKYFPDGKFIVVWESWEQEGASSGYGVYGRVFDENGVALSEEIRINNYTDNYQWYADVVTIDSEIFAVAWCSWEQDGYDGGIYFNRFNLQFESENPEMLVNSNREFYQWLPKIFKTPSGNTGFVWSSWKQDGSREGIYSKIIDAEFREVTFEERINDTGESYQWEPSAVALDDYEIFTLWSNYDEELNNYDVVGKRSELQSIETVTVKTSYEHTGGLSTTSFVVNIVDSASLTGDNYEISFSENDENKFFASIKNLNTGSTVVPELLLDQGEFVYYLTPVFEGIAVEIKPVFALEVDFNKSEFVNNSGSNIDINLVNPSGTTVIAPLDIALIWGDASKNPDGTYISPLDSAYSSSGVIEVKTPFTTWDLTNNKKIFSFIIEPSGSKNKQWDPGESIVIITPEEYQNFFPNFHVQINSVFPQDNLNYPEPGDSVLIYTRRPLSAEDKFTFSTANQFITSAESSDNLPGSFELMQNYPNPFNPSTTISFAVPTASNVKLKVFNIIGQLVYTIKDEFMQPGNYKVLLNADTAKLHLSSGVYFYTLETGNNFIAKKMILLK